MKRDESLNNKYIVPRRPTGRPAGRPKSLKNGGVQFWNYEYSMPPKPPKKKTGRKVSEDRIYGKFEGGKKITHSQRQAYRMCLFREGLFVKNHYKGDVPATAIYKHLSEPIERYELLEDKIIRTVDTFNYISMNTTMDGKCRSFRSLHKKFSVQITGKEKIDNISDIIWQIFGRRYFLQKFVKHDSGKESDLNIRIKWVSFYLSKDKYFLVCMANQSDNKYTNWNLFKADHRQSKLNYTVPLKMSQEQIFENLKNGTIKKVNLYGFPEIVYTPEQVLEKLKV